MLVVALGLAPALAGAVSPEDVRSDSSTRDPGAIRRIVYDAADDHFRFFPITNYLNTAFDTAQVSLAFGQESYWQNHDRVFDIIAHPHENIVDDGGYDELLEQEFASSRVLPNITLHLLGNGYDFRILAEWFDHHRIPYPYVAAFLTSYAGYIGNEAIEASNSEIDSLDHIADLFIFNLAGNLMFTSDTVTDFFHHRMQMRNWTGQPVFDTRRDEIRNASNNYILRPRLWNNGIRPFVYFGLHYFGGLALELADATELSIGAGLAARDPLREGDSFADEFKKIRASGGVFWDADDRLLASVIFNGTNDYLVRTNLYPGLFQNDWMGIGFFMAVSDGMVPSFGVTIEKILALGFS